MSATDASSVSTCHIWNGAKTSRGYGTIQINKVKSLVHRHAYAHYHGLSLDDLKGLVIRHICDVPSCANPLHLLAGTQAENLQDMRDKNRANTAKGEQAGRAKLTERQVIAIRADNRATAEIQKDYGINSATVSMIKRRVSWTHVPPADDELPPPGKPKGVRSGRAKLTEDDVLAIRADPRSQTAIGRDYGIDRSQVANIKYRKQWRHIA